MSDNNNAANQPGYDSKSQPPTQADLDRKHKAPKTPPRRHTGDTRESCSPKVVNCESLSAHITGEKQTHAKMGKTLLGEVLSGYIIDVPNLVEEKLSDKVLGRGLGRWVYGAGSEKAKSFTTKVSNMVSYLKEKSILGKIGSYSRPEKQWVPWRATKRALLEEQSKKLQKKEEEEQTQEKPQAEQPMHPKQEHPSASETNVKKTAREDDKRLSELSDEENTANFLNAIGDNIREMHNIDRLAFDDRVFSARFRHCSPADAAVDCIRKPDLVVLERWAADAPDAMWRDIKALLEIKRLGSEAAQKDAYRELLNCVRMVFAAQVDRRFVMGATVCENIMTFYIFDRSGCLVSETFDMNENVEQVVRVVCGMLFVDEIRLGYDPTISRDKDGRIVVKFKGVKYTCAEDPLYVEKSVRGRGTGCFETLYLGEPAVIKDAWVDDSRSRLEHDILEIVKDVEGVVKVVDHEIVQVPNDDDEWQNDTTSSNRKTLIEHDHWKTDAKWTGFDLVETRTHRRIILQPCGGPLEGFANLRELLVAIKDVVKCVQDILKKGVLHRDISMRNIILAKADPKDPKSRIRAYLIDFDYALVLKDQEQGVAKGARTGTLPFMALEMLTDGTSNDVPHAYYHDLESIFYTLCWICTFQEGPNNTERDPRTFDFSKSEVAKWTGAGMENPKLDDIRRCKAEAVKIGNEFIEKVVTQFAPYFEPIKDCVINLRDVMVNVSSKPKDPRAVERTNKHIATVDSCKQAGTPISPDMLMFIPSSLREPCDVFDTIYKIIEGTLDTLVEPPLPPACTPEAKAKAKAEEEARKEAKQMKFRKYMSIREMQEETEANLRVKESEATEEAEEVKRKKRQMDEKEEEEEKKEERDDPAYQSWARATSGRYSLRKQAAMNQLNARNTSSSVPGLTHSGPSDSVSGTSSRSVPSSPSLSSPNPASRIDPPSSMESIGSKRPFDDDDEKSRHRARMRKEEEKQQQLPQPKGPYTQHPFGDSSMPSSVESTRSKRSSAESLDDDSVTNDSQKRMRLEKL